MKKQKILYIIAAITLIFTFIFGAVGFYKITKYKNSDSYYSKNINAYVGGDAYNYIINGTYFAGYCALSGACLICSCITFSVGMVLSKMDKKSNEDSPITTTSDL